MPRVRVGWVGTGDRTGLATDQLPRLRELSKELPFELIPFSGEVKSRQVAEEAASSFAEQGVDLVLFQCQGFSADGETIVPFTEIGARLAIWAIPEPAREGPLPLNSLTGFNLFSSVVGSYLREKNISVKWFYGDAHDDLFLNRFEVTVRALAAVKDISTAKVALVGGIAPGFVNLSFSQERIKRQLGARIDEIDIKEVFDRAQGYTSEVTEALASDILKKATSSTAPAESVSKSARVIMALQDTLAKGGYDALAVSCWPAFGKEMGIFPCLAFGWLNDMGVIVSCEGDVMGALSMLALGRAADDRAMLMDLVEVDTTENAVVWWHCGVGLPSYADAEGLRLITYPSYVPPGAEPRPMPGAAVDMYFRPQPATVLRLTNDGSQALIVSADIIEGPDRAHTGVRGWFGNLSLAGEPVTPLEMLDAVVRYGVEHHYAIVRGSVAEAMIEFAHWMGIEVITKKPYTNYL